MAVEVEKYLSIIDSERFGIKVAKINKFDFAVEEYINEFKKHKIDVVFARLQSDNVLEINKLEEAGFLLKDIQITYRYLLKNLPKINYSFNHEVTLRDASIDDLIVLSEIALESFKSYGHYYKDNKLDSSKVGEVYEDWIRKSLTVSKIADKVIVAEYKGRIAGFLSFKIYSDIENYAAGGLGAVSAKYRNLNIFKDINVAGLYWAYDIGLDWVEHNVLVSNFPVNRVYNHLGFHIKDSFVTLHGWL